MNFLSIFIIMLLSSCSSLPSILPLPNTSTEGGIIDPEIDGIDPEADNLTLPEKEKLYPYFQVVVAGFCLRGFDPADRNDPANYDPNARKITIAEKRIIFQALDWAKFIVNSEEYKQELLYNNQPSPISERNMTGDVTSIQSGELFDKQRMMDTMRENPYNLTLQKGYIQNVMTSGKTGVGISIPVLGSLVFWQTIYPYVCSLDNIKLGKDTILFPNRYEWNGTTISGLLLHHEISHNLGFEHGLVTGNGTAYFDSVFNTVNIAAFRTKYAKKWQAFQGYHEEKYAHFLQSDTVIPPPTPSP